MGLADATAGFGSATPSSRFQAGVIVVLFSCVVASQANSLTPEGGNDASVMRPALGTKFLPGVTPPKLPVGLSHTPVMVVFSLIVVAAAAHCGLRRSSRESALVNKWLGNAFLCLVYMSIMISYDLFVKYETQANAVSPIPQMNFICAVEVAKLLVTGLLLVFRAARGFLARPSLGDTMVACKLMAVVSFIYSVNNNLIFYLVAHVDFSRLSIWRQLTPVFTGLIWVTFFRRSLGKQRWGAICLMLLGTSLNCIGGSSQGLSGMVFVDASCLLTLCVCLLTATASVANEHALTSLGQMDIDFLCFVGYIQTSVFSLSVLLACSYWTPLIGGGTQSTFMGGWTSLFVNQHVKWMLVAQVLFGFVVARVLRALGSMPRIVMNSVKELAVVIMAPLFMQSHLSRTVALSAFVVGSAAVIFSLAPALPASEPIPVSTKNGEQGCCKEC